jgi:hypothetical protein
MTTKTKITYYATLPDGYVIKRGTARSYSHVVAFRPTFSAKHAVGEHAWEYEHHHGKWCTAGWCGSFALAEKLAHKQRLYYQSIGAGVEVEILETRGEP